VTIATVNWVLSKEKVVSCLAKELVDIPMVLGHPFDELVELLDEIADLQPMSQPLLKRQQCRATSSQQR